MRASILSDVFWWIWRNRGKMYCTCWYPVFIQYQTLLVVCCTAINIYLIYKKKHLWWLIYKWRGWFGVCLTDKRSVYGGCLAVWQQGRKVGMGARVMVWVASYWPSILCPCHSYQVHPYPSCNIWSSLRILALHDDASGCNRNLTLTTSGWFTYYVICQCWGVSHSQPLPLVTNCTTPLSFPHHWKDESSIITRLERGFGST